MKKVMATMLAAVITVSSTFAFAEDVYATKNGKRYHKADCLLVKDKGAKVLPLEEAMKKGLKPCRRCFGEMDAAKKDEQTVKAEPDNNSLAAQTNK